MFCNRFAVLSIILLQISVSNLIKSGIKEQQRKSGYIDGDFIIGALFPIHERPQLNGSSDPLACGVIRENYGIQRIEAAFFAIDSINKYVLIAHKLDVHMPKAPETGLIDSSLLPGIKLGINIKDECWSESVALHQTIKLLEEPTLQDDDETYELTCLKKNEEDNVPLLGIIGPGSSSATIQVQNLLKLFKIPQIGYSATTLDLDDIKNYPYFARVVPSDMYQILIMLKILKNFNWNYVSILYTKGTYGESGSNMLQRIAPIVEVCISNSISVPSADDDDSYDYVIEELLEDDKVTVLVCFCEGSSIRGIMKAFKKYNVSNRYQLIGSDGWSSRYSVVEDYEEQARGSFTVGIRPTIIEEFNEYYLKKNLINNKRNPWFDEFWEYRFDCKINATENTTLPMCTGLEDLKEDHDQDLKIPYVIESIYAMAHGLHKMQADICKNDTNCDELYPFNSTTFMEYLLKVNFSYYDDFVNFTSDRGPWNIRYRIFNFQKLSNDSYDYVEIGQYNGNFDELYDKNVDYDYFSLLKFYGKMEFTDGSAKPPKSTCSDPCPLGFIQLSRSGQEKLCCWNCVPCQVNEIQLNKTTCEACPVGFQPNSNRSHCFESPIYYTQWTDLESIISLTLSFIGIVLTLVVSFVFVKHRDTPVVKSSTRELCYLMLIGMIMAHSLALGVIAKPSMLSCTVVRTIPAISFTIIYAALLVKTNRIARILAISKKKFPNLNPKFMSLKAQIVITSILIATQILICGLMLIKEPPIPHKQNYFYMEEYMMWLECPISKQAIVIPFSYVALLILMCTMYAVKTRNLPDNFNEAKFIGFAMYVTCITWIAFSLVYYGSDFQTITTCLSASINSLVILTFQFFPKIYIILWAPEKNTRAYFTTSKGIRCIIGKQEGYSDSSKRNSHETNFKYIPTLNLKKIKSTASESQNK